MARVLVVSFSVVPGPDRHGVQLLHVLRALANRFTVDVLTLRVGELAYVERFQKTRMLRVPLPDAPLAQQVEAFRRALRRQLEGAEYEVVHFRDGWSGLPIIERQQTLGIRTVFDVGRSTLGEPRPADVALAADLEKAEELCCSQSDLVLVPTEMARRYLGQKQPRLRQDRILVVPPGVDVDRFDAEPSDAPAGPPRVMYVGALAPGHGVRVLLRAMRDVVARTPARLTLVGPVEKGFQPHLTEAIRQLELESVVELAGPVENEDIARVLARAAVCVAPQASDIAERPTGSFPTKILEYMACRRPTVAARRTSVAELIEENADGLLFEPGDPRDLAEKLLKLLLDAKLRERIAQLAHRRVRERFPASAARRLLLEAYGRLVPPSGWQPVGAAAPPVQIPNAQTGTVVPGLTPAAPARDDPWDLLSDDTGGGPTTVTAPPPELLGPEPMRAAAEDDTLTRVAPVRPPAGPVPTDTEPWIVITPQGAIARVRRQTARPFADDGDGTPADGTTPPPPLAGPSFVAGELEVPAERSQVTPRPELATGPTPAVEVDLPEEVFVAAGQLLGPPGARAGVDKKTGAK